MIITNHVAQQDSISFYTPPQTLTYCSIVTHAIAYDICYVVALENIQTTHLTQGNADATFQLMSYANPAQYLRYCAGYYIYIYIPLNNFVGSSFSMASLVLQGTLSLPVPHSLRQASTFRTLPITFPFS